MYSNNLIFLHNSVGRLLKAGLVFFVLVCAPVQAQVSPEVQQLLIEKNYPEALKIANDLLRKTPRERQLWSQKGSILIRMKNYPAAIAFHKKYARKFKKNPEVQTDLAQTYRLAGKYNKAAAQLKKIIVKFPNHAPAYEALGDVLTILAAQTYTAGANATTDNKWLLAKRQAVLDIDQRMLENYASEVNSEADRRSNKPISEQVTNTMHSWVNAWNKKDLNTYLTHFTRDYKPATGRSTKSWVDRTRKSFDQSEYIKVYIDDLEMKKIDDQTVSVKFREVYESNLFESVSRKEIVLVRVLNSWLISQEVVTNG